MSASQRETQRQGFSVLAYLTIGVALISIVLAGWIIIVETIVNPKIYPGRLIGASFAGLLGVVALVRTMQAGRAPVAVTQIAPRPLYGTGNLAPQLPGNVAARIVKPESLYSSAQVTSSQAQPPPPAASRVKSITEDPLYQLERLDGDVRCFILPKEGESIYQCQDSYAANPKQRRFAVTDGVSASFVPRPWARLIARGFVDYAGNLQNEEEFAQWLEKYSQQWHKWMYQRWVPTINAQRAYERQPPEDWRAQIEDTGAQTTLIGCSLRARPQQRDSVDVTMVSIGDAEGFGFHNVAGQWERAAAFPYQEAASFTSTPMTLSTVTSSEQISRTLREVRTTRLTLQQGDLLVLATDSLAKWMLASSAAEITQLLSITRPEQFSQFVKGERARLRLEDDDTTLFIVPIHG